MAAVNAHDRNAERMLSGAGLRLSETRRQFPLQMSRGNCGNDLATISDLIIILMYDR